MIFYKTLLLTFAFWLAAFGLSAQDDDFQRPSFSSQAAADTQAVLELLRQASNSLGEQESGEKLFEALNLARATRFNGGIRLALERLTDRELRRGNRTHALVYALELLEIFDRAKNNHEIFNACLLLGGIYEGEKFFKKALDYYQRAEKISSTSLNETERLNLQSKLAHAFLENKQADEAYPVFGRLLAFYEKNDRYPEAIRSLQKLADCSVALKDFAQSRQFYQKLEAMTALRGDVANQVTAMNDLGYTANLLGDYPDAVRWFEQAEALNQEGNWLDPALLYTNLGIAWHNRGDVARSIEYLNLAKQHNRGAVQNSYLDHLMATIYLKNNDIYNALRHNELALEEAQRSRSVETLCNSFNTASQIHQQLFEYEKALDFFKKHLALKDSLLLSERLQRQTLLAHFASLERSEEEVKILLARQELNQLQINQLQLRNEKLSLETEKNRLEGVQREKELALLRSEKEAKEANLRAAQLETDRTEQALKLATQELLAEKQQRQITSLSQKEREAKLELEREQAQEKEREKQIALLQSQQEISRLELDKQETFRRNAYWAGALAALIIALITGGLFYARRLNNRLAKQNFQIEAQNREIAEERARAEDLLLNILPSETAAELKATGKAAPRHYESATVMFTDFTNFTNISSHLSPEQVLDELNTCFLAFDDIAERHGLEKIKTIGDSYMCAGGLPLSNQTHAADSVAAALEILAFMKQHNARLQKLGRQPWSIRIGIHTGELAAGVVGSKKFAYDIWGDTVNVASRMENACLPDQINLSEATYSEVREKFPCTYRGEVDVKNKGLMGMYFVG